VHKGGCHYERFKGTEAKKEFLKGVLSEGNGVVRLAPCWVPRAFLVPGRRLKLAPKDLYAFGAHRGGIDERWLASTTKADNGPETIEDEGLSYIVGQTTSGIKKILLKEAIELMGNEFLGSEVISKYGGWKLLSKFFDNMGPIPHHMHQMDIHAKKVGREGKPESYYFPVQLNIRLNNFPYTFFGLEPGTTKEDIKRCLARWEEGDNGILRYSKAYVLTPRTGWDLPAGILHAPGSLVTYELQWASDVFAIFQSMVEGRYVPRELLTKDVPEENYYDIDYLVDMLDWEKNVDPYFVKNRFRTPIPVSEEKEGFNENWIVYGNDLFSAKELSVSPGASVTIKDSAAYGMVVLQGHGKIEGLSMESPTMIKFGQLTDDEFFITYQRAKEGVTIRNDSSEEELVILKHFGPGNIEAPIIE